jgi:hypothetical protein
MIKGNEKRKVDHPIESLILDRCSPGPLTGEGILLPRES